MGHPSHRFTETYIVERYHDGAFVQDTWVELARFSTHTDAITYVRANTPAFSPWRIVRLRTETRSEVLDSQPIPDLPATPKESHR